MTGDPIRNSATTQPNGVAPHPSQVDHLVAFLAEVSWLAMRLRQVRLSAGGVTILQILNKRGPQTVPQIARVRSTSRQNIQVLVNGLKREGCVELTPNPAHKRSALVSLTTDGRAMLAREAGREDEFLERLARHLPAAAIAAASDLLRQIQGLLSEEKGAEPPRRCEGKMAPPAERTAPAAEPGQSEAGELPVSLL